MGSKKSSDFCKVTQREGAELGLESTQYQDQGWPKDQIRTAASSILVSWVRMESGGIGLLLGFSRCSHAIVRPVKPTRRVTARRALYSLPSCYRGGNSDPE